MSEAFKLGKAVGQAQIRLARGDLLELLDEIEAYVHRYKAWPAAKGLELREEIEKEAVDG